jgi:hypothetical protein
MSAQIFISYRRDATAGHVERLVERLRQEYDEDTVFMDKPGIQPGAPFPEVLRRAVDESEVVLAVIDPQWLSCKKAHSEIRRLDCEDDWVREELRRALLARKDGRVRWIIPILVAAAPRPEKNDLPEPIKGLSDLEPFKLSTEIGPVWDKAILTLVELLDQKLEIPPEERARAWLYDEISKPLRSLTEKQRRQIASALSLLDERGDTEAFSPRALAKRFYRIGPAAMESLRQSTHFDKPMRRVLELLKDYWVDVEEANKLAGTWKSHEAGRVAIVQGQEPAFTPDCVVQKASNEINPWRMIPITTGASQPSVHDIISDIHTKLRTDIFKSLRMRKGLPDSETPEVTQFLQECLKNKAIANRPVAVQLDDTGAADERLIRAIQATFPHLRILILAPDNRGVFDLVEKYDRDVERNSTTIVIPEKKPGDEQRAVNAYYNIADDFTQTI